MPTYYNPNPQKVSLPFIPWTINPGQEIETQGVLSAAELSALGITEIAVTPYFDLTLGYQTLTFAGAETKVATALIESKIIRVVTDVSLVIAANEAANPNTYPLLANREVDIVNEHTIEELHLTSSGAGVANVILLTG